MSPTVEQGARAGTREGAVDGGGGPAPLVRHERGDAQELGLLECAGPWPNIEAGFVGGEVVVGIDRASYYIALMYCRVYWQPPTRPGATHVRRRSYRGGLVTL